MAGWVGRCPARPQRGLGGSVGFLGKIPSGFPIWVWVNTYRYIFSGMNIHLPAILMFTRYQGFDPSPYVY